ncbi:protein ALP1-like [Xenia sp. Carnegie-2017]|uniref:protein ALP1-like n=1 Tax=Xenia sp. Carnegie-2017 TaxID=2897299 RepID=UPI001F0380F8|nr:protein ALP1-like [Xenia sp. Carnegie-2017]
MHPRSLVWFDMVDELYNDELWYANFRVTKSTFEFILNRVRQEIDRKITPMRTPVSAKRRLAITLYYLSCTAEYRTVANLFGVSRSLVCQCIKEVSCAIIKHFPKAITFPKGDDLFQVLQGYEEQWGFPMRAGAIDGTHIAPANSNIEYVNRRGFHSIVMQAVADCNYMFLDVVIGWPGSVHDARILSNSTLFSNGNKKRLFPPDVVKEISGVEIAPFLLGDPAYPLLSWLIKGYPKNGATEEQKKFNYHLSRARMTVENTFGRWKGRYARFSKRLDMEVASSVDIIHASCILHNICELQKNEFMPDWDSVEIVDDAFVVVPIDEIEPEDAYDIRAALSNYFS